MWFWPREMAARPMDSPHCFKMWRHFWVRMCTRKRPRLESINSSPRVSNFRETLVLILISTLQLSSSWVSNAWNSRWENWCIRLWRTAVGTHHWASSSWLFTAKPCYLGKPPLSVWAWVCTMFLLLLQYLMTCYFLYLSPFARLSLCWRRTKSRSSSIHRLQKTTMLCKWISWSWQLRCVSSNPQSSVHGWARHASLNFSFSWIV